MNTIKSIHDKVASHSVGCEYTLVLIAKNDSDDTYGIATQDTHEDKLLCIKEIGTDKELAISIVDVLNHHKVSHVHFFDVVNDLINE